MKMEKRLKKYKNSRKVRALLGERPKITPAEDHPNYVELPAPERKGLGHMVDVVKDMTKRKKAQRAVMNRAQRRQFAKLPDHVQAQILGK